MKNAGDVNHEFGTGGRQKRGLRACALTRRVLVLSAFISLCLPLFAVFAQDDMVKMIETKRAELQEKEASLKREEQRLAAVRKDVDERIDKYTKLLAQVEAILKKVEQVKGDKMESVVKAYEVMAPEDAAVRISALDDDTALQIMSRMKSKKAGAVIAVMNPQKAANLTRSMLTLKTKQ